MKLKDSYLLRKELYPTKKLECCLLQFIFFVYWSFLMSTSFDYNTIRSLRHCDIMNLFMFTVSKKKVFSKPIFLRYCHIFTFFSVKLELLVLTQVATSTDKYLDSAFLNLLEYYITVLDRPLNLADYYSPLRYAL